MYIDVCYLLQTFSFRCDEISQKEGALSQGHASLSLAHTRLRNVESMSGALLVGMKRTKRRALETD